MIEINKCDLLDLDMEDIREYISSEFKQYGCVDSSNYMEDRFLDVISAIKNIGEDNSIKKWDNYIKDLDKYFMIDDILYKIYYTYDIVRYHNYVTDRIEEYIENVEFTIDKVNEEYRILDVENVEFKVIDNNDNIKKLKQFMIDNNINYKIIKD